MHIHMHQYVCIVFCLPMCMRLQLASTAALTRSGLSSLGTNQTNWSEAVSANAHDTTEPQNGMIPNSLLKLFQGILNYD